jgi:hypothetical protein
MNLADSRNFFIVYDGIPLKLHGFRAHFIRFQTKSSQKLPHGIPKVLFEINYRIILDSYTFIFK